jgi:subtilase family serine protease
MADGTASIEESNEENNEMSIAIDSEARDHSGGDSNNVDRGPAIIVASIGVIAISIAALQMGPGRVRKPFRKK